MKEKKVESVNILILSCGTRNKLMQYFRENLRGKGKLIAADCSELAPALYEADAYYVIPHMKAPGYLETVFDICRREAVSGVLSLIDPELSVLAEHEEEFKNLGVTVIGSPLAQCEMSRDKYKMYLWLKEHGYGCARSYVEKEEFYRGLQKGEISYPVFIKPVKGSASVSISKAADSQTVELLLSHRNGLMIQEFLEGQEIGADVYIDLISGEAVSIFTKKKLKMRAGETDKAVSFRDEKLFALLEKFVTEAGFRGQIDIDVFERDGEYFISEVNPRFGGGYPHAYESGVNHIEMILNNLRGEINPKQIGCYKEGVYMMKYNEVKIL